MDNFGQQVSQSDADRYFANFYNIKKRSQKKLRAALKGDKEALRYYCGDPKQKDKANKKKKGEDQDWAFVFNEESLKRLLAKMKKQGGNCVFVFNGAHDDGKPTAMLIPAKYDEAVAKKQADSHAFNLKLQPAPKKTAKAATALGSEDDPGTLIAGEQHPGTGGGEGFMRGETAGIPKGFFDNDYSI